MKNAGDRCRLPGFIATLGTFCTEKQVKNVRREEQGVGGCQMFLSLLDNEKLRTDTLK